MNTVRDVAEHVEIDPQDLVVPQADLSQQNYADDGEGVSKWTDVVVSGKANWFRRLTLLQHLSGVVVGSLAVGPYLLGIWGQIIPLEATIDLSSKALSWLRRNFENPHVSNIILASSMIHVATGLGKTYIRSGGKKDDDVVEKITPRLWERYTGYGLMIGGSLYYYRRQLATIPQLAPIVKLLQKSSWSLPLSTLALALTLTYHQFTGLQFTIPTLRALTKRMLPDSGFFKIPPWLIRGSMFLTGVFCLTSWLSPTSSSELREYDELVNLLTE